MNRSALSELGRRTGPPPISWLMHLSLARPKLISLAAGFTDNESLPVDMVRDLVLQVFRNRRTARTALQYGSTQGEPELRRLTADHIRQLDGAGQPGADLAGRMIVSNGSQQMLYMIMEALCDPGDIVLVEDPTYFVFLGIVQSHGLRARVVPMTAAGLDPVALDKVLQGLRRTGELRRVKALYLVSYFQNPTGITTAYDRKAEVLACLRSHERAAGHPIYLIEDAAYRELRFRGSDVPSALAASGRGAQRVIYAGTYSKPFATGARVGFGILPEPVFTAVLRIKGNHDFGTSNLLQHLLARALASGAYETQLRRLRATYSAKARLMQSALRRHFPPQITWDEPQGGLYFWAQLPRGTRCGIGSDLFEAALRQDVLYVPGELCYAADPTRRKPAHQMRISFGSATASAIRVGIDRLGAVLCRKLEA